MVLVNVNVGLLGHVDSGKTSLARQLSTEISTASLDKDPQSQARGITLDLGFTAFRVGETQVTLVDCPGHASLIRTVLGGARIMDAMVLVIDATKGFQTQTAECLVIGELVTDCAVVALNKSDLLRNPGDLDKLQRRIRKTLQSTRFSGCPIVPTSARSMETAYGIDALRETILGLVDGAVQDRLSSSEAGTDDNKTSSTFLFLVDHCFALKGKGTIATGTVLRGRVQVGDTIERPGELSSGIATFYKVKSIQSFHKPVYSAVIGDRIGMNIPQLDPNGMERGLLTSCGATKTSRRVVIYAQSIRFYQDSIRSRTRFHINVGHRTTMGTIQFFLDYLDCPGSLDKSSLSIREVESLSEFSVNACHADDQTEVDSSWSKIEHRYLTGHNKDGKSHCVQTLALLLLDEPIPMYVGELVVLARLDMDHAGRSCRLALSGVICEIDPMNLKFFRWKEKIGRVERILEEEDSKVAIVRSLFKKESDFIRFLGHTVIVTRRGEKRDDSNIQDEKVEHDQEEPCEKSGQGNYSGKDNAVMVASGVIDSTFGKSGKVKVRLTDPNGMTFRELGTNAAVHLRYRKFAAPSSLSGELSRT